MAKEAVERIAGLYGIEKKIRRQPPDIKKSVRQEHAKPPLETLQACYQPNRTGYPPNPRWLGLFVKRSPD
ncbi:MAG: transposase [Kordiimonadaceae bacterium]|nr:transposase [Kordiimonadaceae bacterium]